MEQQKKNFSQSLFNGKVGQQITAVEVSKVYLYRPTSKKDRNIYRLLAMFLLSSRNFLEERKILKGLVEAWSKSLLKLAYMTFVISKSHNICL